MKLSITLTTNDKSAQWSEPFPSPAFQVLAEAIEAEVRAYNATVSDVNLKLAYTLAVDFN